jgi:enterochelin esterase-like enzyme
MTDNPNSPASPRVAQLQAALLAGDATALDRFWREVAQTGAPLVESIASDAQHVLVTFVWQAKTPTNQVAVIQDWGGANRLENQLHMHRLLDSDLWFASRRLKRDTRLLYQLSLNDPRLPWTIPGERATASSGWQRDPLNPHACLVIREDAERSSKDLSFSALELPGAPAQPLVAKRDEVPAGTVNCERFRSAALGNERRVWTYTPPDFDPAGEPYALLVVLDGKEYIDLIPTPTILDNARAARLIPPLVAVFPDSLGWETRVKELTCYPQFLDFLTQELLPWAQPRLHTTADPARTVIAGSSLGGLAAAYAGFSRPDRFGTVLSQTGAFEWTPPGEAEQEWLTRQVARTARLPLRFYLDVGNLETEPRADGGPSHLVANRHMRTVLEAKGYPLRYVEYSGGHDILNLQGTLSDGLMTLFGQ